MLHMANTIMNNVEVAVMNKMMAKLDIQDITGLKDMVDTVDGGSCQLSKPIPNST